MAWLLGTVTSLTTLRIVEYIAACLGGTGEHTSVPGRDDDVTTMIAPALVVKVQCDGSGAGHRLRMVRYRLFVP